MAKFDPAPPLTSDSRATQKLKLEIIELRKKTRWQLTPAITALISVAGLVISVWLFGRQQASEQEKNRVAEELGRRATLQNRISSETDEILRFPGDPKLTISRVNFLLADIQSMLDSPVSPISVDPQDKPPKKLADVVGDYQKRLTPSLVILVRDECDLSRNARDAGLARAIAKSWPGYPEYLAENPLQDLNWILWKYTKALEEFHQQNPGYLESFVQTEGAFKPGSRYIDRRDEDLRYGRLVDLSDGFTEHLKVLCREPLTEEAKALRQGRFEEVQIILANRIVSDFLLEAKTDKEFCESALRKEE